MGLLDFLSPALTVATNAAGTYQNAQAQGNQEKMQGVIQAIQIARQQRQAEIENIKNLAEANKNNAEAGTFTPEFAGAKAGAEAQAQWPTVLAKLNQDHQNRLSEIQAQGGNELAVAQENIRARAALQDAQHDFIVNKVQPFDAAQQTGRITGQGANQQANTTLQQSGGIEPTLMNGVRGIGNAVKRSVGIGSTPTPPAAPTTPAPVQGAKPPIQQRAQQLKSLGFSQAAAKQQLIDEGYTNAVTQ